MAVEEKEKSQNQSFKIKVDGQEVEVTQDELINLAQQGKDYTKKMQALGEKEKTLKAEETRVAGLKTIVDEMEADPKLKETLNKVYSDFKSGKVAKSDTNKDSNLKKIDKLINDAETPGEREQLRTIREIIQQEAPIEDIKSLKQTIDDLRNEIAAVKSNVVIGQGERVETQLAKVEEKFGKELVDKYRKDIVATAIKFPNQSVTKLLYHFADDTEIETAVLTQAKKKEKDELDRKKRGSSPSGQDNTFAAKSELKKDSKGRVTMDSFMQRVKERLGRA